MVPAVANLLAILITLLAFVVAMGILSGVHEWGHYRAAVAFGVRVETFALGFGKALFRYRPPAHRQRPGQDTEFVIRALPLGGYVKMADSRNQGTALLSQTFDQQSLGARSVIAVAGPLANLALAFVIYLSLGWAGVRAIAPEVSTPGAGTLAAAAGIRAWDVVEGQVRADGTVEEVRSFEQLSRAMVAALVGHKDITLEVRTGQEPSRRVTLRLSELKYKTINADLYNKVGLFRPASPAIVTETVKRSPAEAAGIVQGDKVTAVNGQQIYDLGGLMTLLKAQQQRDLAQISRGPAPAATVSFPSQHWTVEQGAAPAREVTLVPQLIDDVPRTGAQFDPHPNRTEVRYGFLEGPLAAWRMVAEGTSLTLSVFYQIATGQMSLANLSSPISLADYAGKTARSGLVAFLNFLASVSVSLGIFNLLPIPTLDGGHLLTYAAQALRGKPLPAGWLIVAQKFGLAAIMALVFATTFNDLLKYIVAG